MKLKNIHARAAKLIDPIKRQRAYVAATGLYLVERILSIVLSFFVYTALARAYGPTLIGTYTYVQTVMLFAVPFLAMGAEGVIIRELVRGHRPRNEVLGTSFVVMSGVGLVTTVLPLGFIGFSSFGDHTVWQLALFTALSFVPTGFLIIEQNLKADVKAKAAVTVRSLCGFLSAAVKLYLISIRAPLQMIVAVTAVEAFLLSASFITVFQGSGHSIRDWVFNSDYGWFLLKQTLPGMIAAVTVMLFIRANHILLTFLAGFDAVGQYGVAFQVVQLFMVLPHVFFSAIYPRLVHLHAHDEKQYLATFDLCYLVFSIIGYAIILFNYFFAAHLVALVFGSRYAPAGDLIVILSIANLINYLAGVRGRLIDIGNMTHYHVWNASAGLIVLVPISFYLIPRYGAIGAACSIAVASFVTAILTSFMIPALRRTGWSQVRALLLIPSPALVTEVRRIFKASAT
jgi:O-antigen/teichoic acid export membrane protein